MRTTSLGKRQKKKKSYRRLRELTDESELTFDDDIIRAFLEYRVTGCRSCRVEVGKLGCAVWDPSVETVEREALVGERVAVAW